MATKGQIDKVLMCLDQMHLQEFEKISDRTNIGMGAVLKILNESPDAGLSAGKISEALKISEARVTVLVQKLLKKGYIVKENDSTDARIVKIKLTREGKEIIEDLHNDLRRNVSFVIDVVGMEKIDKYLHLSEEIYNAIRQLPPPPKIF